MPATIQANVELPASDILRAVRNFDDCEKAGLVRVETAFQREAGRNAAKIYAESVPSRSSVAQYNRRRRGATLRTARPIRSVGPAWKRTGNLERAIKAPPIWAGPAAVEVRLNLNYGEPRNQLGVGRIPKRPALGKVRRQPFWSDALQTLIPQSADLFINGFNSKWENS